MNRSDLRTLALQYLDDVNAGYHTTTIVNSWLNLAQKEVQKMLILAHENYYLKTVQTSLVLNQAEYVLPSDFFMINMVEIVTGGTAPNEIKYTLMPITQNQRYLLASLTNGSPEAYFLKRDTIEIVPVSDGGSLYLRLHYHYRVADMSNDSDVPDIPEQYRELISVMAAKRGFIRDDRMPQNLLELEQQYMRMMKDAAEDRRVDQPRMITQTNSDFTGQW